MGAGWVFERTPIALTYQAVKRGQSFLLLIHALRDKITELAFGCNVHFPPIADIEIYPHHEAMIIAAIALLSGQSLAEQVHFYPRHHVREAPLTAAYRECALRRIPYLHSVLRQSRDRAALRSMLECSMEREIERRAVIRDQLPDDRGDDGTLIERLVQMCAAEEARDELTGVAACAATNTRLRMADDRVLGAALARFHELERIERERNSPD